MLSGGERLVFVLLAVALGAWGAWRLGLVVGAITGGVSEPRRLRIGRALIDVVSQRTVLRHRPAVGLLHAPLFYGFVVYLVTNAVEIARGFRPVVLEGLGWGVYRLGVDLLSVAILLGMAALLVRRFVLGYRWMGFGAAVRLHDRARGGISRDSAIVGSFIIVHVGSRLLLEAWDLASTGADPFQPAASAVRAMLVDVPPVLRAWGQHAAWWLAVGSVLLFWPYFASSKHLHLLAGPVKLLVRAEHPAALRPIDLNAAQPLGASLLDEMPWPRRLDAWACIQCLRCQDVCPAHATGGVLSPAAMVISERYEVNRVLALRTADRWTSRPLLEFAISEEAVWACTTCGACLEACPVGAEPMLHILDVRRHLAMEAARVPRAAHQVFDGLADLGHPFKGVAVSRTAWMQGLGLVPMQQSAGRSPVLGGVRSGL